MKKLLIVWGNWGPYHYARFRALHERAEAEGIEAHGLELFPKSGCYDWRANCDHPAVHHLNLGRTETEFNLPLLCSRFLPLLFKLRPDILFVPSYWHWSLFINYAGRLQGAKIVMMNESHAGTERARGWKRAVKRSVVRNFHAALVGGTPHRRHFSRLGLNDSAIYLGYDTVDNEYFTAQSEAARRNAESLRKKFELPEKYFLNLGRMVKKKNLTLLILAYARLMERSPHLAHDLVLVGSGEEYEKLRALCRELRLAVIDHTSPANNALPAAKEALVSAGYGTPGRLGSDTFSAEKRLPAVHFYGFRQIEENPVFYGLASAFVLPSVREEWGLVVNEALACGLPVIVSKNAGCAEDLVVPGRNGLTFDPHSVEELAAALAKVADPSVAAPMGIHSLRIAHNWGCDRFASGALAAASTALGPALTKQPTLS